ncbi:MAG: hypothetical protein J7604_12015 [Sporocytophaga sp.]|uniref:hypothetical protein n=1 Tax=Sporocytophaga sp. TaxID=2231183 RepID=UPI001B0A3121|nr:hypothetical protein [Sporocytophaga sp.]MBO9700928.1 hypothetical protein [Sporocytophaga sp.]
MKNIQIVTKRIELKFDSNGVAITDVEPVIDELSKEYNIIDNFPSITIQENYLYVTFKASKKNANKSNIGFNFGTKGNI